MAKVATETSAKKSTPDAVKAKGAPERKGTPEREVKVLASVNSKALSTDVGPKVIADMAGVYKEEAKVNEMVQSLNVKRYDILSSLTMACVKAAKADDTINLAATFSGDTKQMNLLNDQLGLALGVREVVIVGKEGSKTGKKIGYSKAVAKYFPQPNEKKDTAAYTQKATLRTNYLHQLKKAAQAAAAIIEKDMQIKTDAKAGTLMISGPGVKEQFGVETVLLNEKQKVQTEQGEVTLKEKPSFTALANMGALLNGGQPRGRKPDAAKAGEASTGPALDPEQAVAAIAKQLVSLLSGIKEAPSAKMRSALDSVVSAIDRVTKIS